MMKSVIVVTSKEVEFYHLGCEEVVRTLVVSDSEKFLL